MIVIIFLIIFVIKPDLTFNKIDFRCPNLIYLNYHNLFFMIPVTLLLLFFSSDSYTNIQSDKRKMYVMLFALSTFLYHSWRIIYRVSTNC